MPFIATGTINPLNQPGAAAANGISVHDLNRWQRPFRATRQAMAAQPRFGRAAPGGHWEQHAGTISRP